MMRTIGSVLMTVVIAVGIVISTPDASAAPPAGACNNPDPARPPVTAQPWAQQMLDPRSVWPHSTGAGVLVAVVDSGVDADHPQLKAPGTVLRGRDFHLVGNLPGNFDCISHGTAVASIIAADPVDGVGFVGLAPDAGILPVRVTDRDLTDTGQAAAIDPAVLARGIRYAADQGAKVINLSLAGTADNRYVRDAVAYARGKDALVVAVAGNGQQGTTERTLFPAGYEGVLGVGAVDQTGTRLPSSQIGPHVDLVAPGGAVLGATRAGGHQYWQGTSFAAPFVSATAALVRAAWPTLTADQVAERILATATPAPGGRGSPAYGAGLVNPYRAVTDGLVTAPPAGLAALTLTAEDPERARTAARWEATARTARWSLGAAGGAVALGLIAALLLGRGRRARWRARPARPLPEQPTPAEPPDQVFLLPHPRG
ncbi:type VII secretion-associated serine protease mycosin [Micromonospora pisi]|uniref:Type VII secretion-associated serine protease mycosin n=1 Tax=Micromonospora pisi TaxID=589240 RepID=A0A495JU98_9ACTN|nr:type VII secretion-associated serine protease mycosin [Micromonospora pisi]RKR91902.1 type VII secretion-associated serine protease mycosin [Micromonospora pisi]